MTLDTTPRPRPERTRRSRHVVACALAASIVLGSLSLSNGPLSLSKGPLSLSKGRLSLSNGRLSLSKSPSTGSGTVDKAIRRRDIVAHGAWMIRAYALAVAAGTQGVTQGIGEGLFGTGELSTELSVSAGWVVNLALAELIIRRPGVRRARTPAT